MSSSDNKSNLPPWLRNAPLPPEPKAAAADAPPQEELPAWLRGEAGAASGTAEDAPIPGWLTNAEPEHPASGDALPSWLADMAADEPPATSSQPANEVPDWLQSSAPELPPATPNEPAASPADDVPSWLSDSALDEVRQIMADDTPADLNVEPFSFGDAATASEAPTTPPSWLSSSDADASDEDVPAWLRDVGAASTPPAQPAPPKAPSADEETPAWLSTPAPEAPASDVPAWLRAEIAAEALPASDDTPSWLSAESPEPAGASGASDAPAWLQSATPADTGAASPAEDLPAWLREPTPEPEPTTKPDLPAWLTPDTPATPATPADESLPAWLAADAPPPTPTPPADESLPAWMAADTTPVAPSGPADPALPAWLAADAASSEMAPPAGDLPPWLRDPTETISPAAVGAAAALPAWLRDEPPATTPAPEAPVASEPSIPVTPEPMAAEAVEAAALAEATPEATAPGLPGIGAAAIGAAAALAATTIVPRDPPPASPPEADSEFFGGADLPAWLRTPEPEPAAPELSPADARSLDWLTSLSSPDDDAAVVAAPGAIARLPLPAVAVRTAAQNESIGILNRLAADPFPDAPAVPTPAPEGVLQRVGIERLLYVLLLLAMLGVAAIPALSAPFQGTPTAPGSAPLFERVSSLTSSDVVLLAYEWDARRISELKPLEQALLQTMTNNHVKLISTSTDPQGALLSYDMLATLEAAGYEPKGVDYLLLGYKPGGELALRQIAQNFPGAPASDFYGDDANVSVLAHGTQTGRPLTGIDALSMIVVMADDPSDVQGWMEQVHSQAPDVPIVFLLPAEANPLVQPYTQLPNVYYLAGRQGALAYRGLSETNPVAGALIAHEAGQQRIGLLVYVALFLIGALLMALTGASSRGKRPA